MRRGFSTDHLRARAVRERTEREAREAAVDRFEALTLAAAHELERCLGEGLTEWREIAPRLRRISENS